MNKWTSKILAHWRFIAFELCILLGGLLILPAFRFVPFMLDSLLTKQQRMDQDNKMDGEFVLHGLTQDTSFNQFIPYFNRGDNARGFSLSKPKAAPFFEGLDFSPDAGQMTLRIFLDGEAFTTGQPVDVSFMPGDRCVFGDGRACIYRFDTSSGGRVVFASVHSGLGAEAEKFRDLIEGTGINRALFDQKKIRKHMRDLAGARISVSQGETQIDGLTLSTVVRIPPEYMTAYMQTPVEEVLDYAIEIGILDPGILSQDILVFETCGWRLPGEAPVPGVADTSTSVYLSMIVSPER